MYVLVIYYKHYNRRIKFMSGIVGSRFNMRGSGLVGSLGSDGHVFTSSGAGAGAVFEAAAGGGKIGQVVQTLKTDGASTTSTTPVTTGLAVAITPVATSSKILINVTLGTVTNRYGGRFAHMIIDGGNCATYIGDAGTGHEAAVSMYAPENTLANTPASLMYLDAPDTTSEVTYTLHYWANAYTALINVVYTPTTDSGNCASTMTAMEVLA
jgi:hypothetical protein